METDTIGEMPSHSHNASTDYIAWLYRGSEYSRGFTAGGSYDGLGSTQQGTTNVTVNTTGGNQSHNILQPYLSIYVWERIN